MTNEIPPVLLYVLKETQGTDAREVKKEVKAKIGELLQDGKITEAEAKEAEKALRSKESNDISQNKALRGPFVEIKSDKKLDTNT